VNITRIGLDLAKNVFELYGVDDNERGVLSRTVRRGRLLQTFAQLPSCLVIMEFCGGAHQWRCALTLLRHRVRLIATAVCCSHRRSNKTDRNDARALCEAGGRPEMRFVAGQSAFGVVIGIGESQFRGMIGWLRIGQCARVSGHQQEVFSRLGYFSVIPKASDFQKIWHIIYCGILENARLCRFYF
jgi:hypothetical protein